MDGYLLRILLTLREGKKSFNDLKNILDMSPNTILMRIREAQTEGLVEDGLVRRKGKKPKISYYLTEEGEKVLETYNAILPRYNSLRKELEKLQKEVREKEKKVRYLLASINPKKESRRN